MIRKMLLPPLATQAFPRGEYTLDFDFNKSDGLSSGTIARFKVNFTNKLNLGDSADSAKQPKEIWAEFSVGDSVMGSRSLLPDDAMVQLLLASDASIATYLTLAYEGDDNPIATIYRDLPLDSSSSGTDLSAYFSTLPATESTRAADNWVDAGANVYTMGNVGIGTADPSLGGKVNTSLTLLSNGTGFAVGRTDGSPAFAVNALSDYAWTMYDYYGGSWHAGITQRNDNIGIGTTDPSLGGKVATSLTLLSDGTGFAVGRLDGNPAFAVNPLADYAWTMYDYYGESWHAGITQRNGAVGIGTGTAVLSYNLSVKGSIGCQELTVTSTGWADFVFDEKYKLPPLTEVEEYISKNKHLPGIPTEAEVKEKGVSVGNISSKLLQKIEELTLYVIDLKKENDSLKAQLTGIQNHLDNQRN